MIDCLHTLYLHIVITIRFEFHLQKQLTLVYHCALNVYYIILFTLLSKLSLFFLSNLHTQHHE
jgi:hypothetical protein